MGGSPSVRGPAGKSGRLVDVNGRVINNTPIEIYDEQGDWVYTVYTYAERVVRADDSIRENFAISDLPAGRYYIRATSFAALDEAQLQYGTAYYPAAARTLHEAEAVEVGAGAAVSGITINLWTVPLVPTAASSAGFSPPGAGSARG